MQMATEIKEKTDQKRNRDEGLIQIGSPRMK